MKSEGIRDELSDAGTNIERKISAGNQERISRWEKKVRN